MDVRIRWVDSVVLFTILCCSVLPAEAAEFFVAPSGSNSNAGTANAPWQTLQFAANRVGAGDCVTVRAGSYVGFQLSTSGRADAPIEFFAEPGVLVNQPETVRNQHGINLENASHVVIDGFSVTGMPRAGVRSVGVNGNVFASNVTIRNVHSYDNQYWGILTGFVNDLLIENNETSGSQVEHGIYVSNSGDRPTIRNNLSWNNRSNGIHVNGDIHADDDFPGDGIISSAVITGNVIYGNGVGGGSGINMDGVQDSRIENNLLYNNHASGISLYRIDGGGGSNGNLVVNNTIHVASDGRWALNIKDGSTGNIAFNNILLNERASYGSIDIDAASLSGFVSDYNIVKDRFSNDDTFISLANWRSQTGQDLHSIIAPPGSLFENWSAGDYELLATAAARDAGIGSLAGRLPPAFDIAGASRPVGPNFDIGAYEFGAATPLDGDFNHDGTVDAADYTVWRDTGGTQQQFLLWKSHFGESNDGAGTGSAATVPEPNTAVLFVVCCLAAFLIHAPPRSRHSR
jgi:hypothetical protein